MQKLFTKEALQHAVENWRAGSQEPIERKNLDYSTLRKIKQMMWNKMFNQNK